MPGMLRFVKQLIKENCMTTITLEGKEYQLDIEQAKKLNLLKEEDNRVRSWKEFVNKHTKSNSFYCVEGIVNQTLSPYGVSEQLTSSEAKAIAAFSRLLKLRRDWIGEWEPDWSNESVRKYIIQVWRNHICCERENNTSSSLSFPTEQMAEEFLETFRDLIEEAKILI